MTTEGTKAEVGSGFEILGDFDSSSDGDAAYRSLLSDLDAHFRPCDALERILIRDLAEACWDIRRLSRHQGWTIGHKAVEALQRHVKADLVDLANRKERMLRARESKARARRLAGVDASIGRAFQIAETRLTEVADEYAHSKSFQRNVAYYGWLSRELEAAARRYEQSLAQLLTYQRVMGRSLESNVAKSETQLERTTTV